MKPTIGQMVHYWLELPHDIYEDEVYPAIITRVHVDNSDLEVDLFVLPKPVDAVTTTICRAAHGATGQPGHWAWPLR